MENIDKLLIQVEQAVNSECIRLVMAVYARNTTLVSFYIHGTSFWFRDTNGDRVEIIEGKYNGSRYVYNVARPTFKALADFLNKYGKFLSIDSVYRHHRS